MVCWLPSSIQRRISHGVERVISLDPHVHSRFIVVCFWQSTSWRHCFLHCTCTDCSRTVTLKSICRIQRISRKIQIQWCLDPRVSQRWTIKLVILMFLCVEDRVKIWSSKSWIVLWSVVNILANRNLQDREVHGIEFEKW